MSPALSDLPLRKITTVIEYLAYPCAHEGQPRRLPASRWQGRGHSPTRHNQARHTWINPAASWYHPYRISRTAPPTITRVEFAPGTMTRYCTYRKPRTVSRSAHQRATCSHNTHCRDAGSYPPVHGVSKHWSHRNNLNADLFRNEASRYRRRYQVRAPTPRACPFLASS